MANVAKLGNSVTQPMQDDQQTAMHLAPVDSAGAPAALPSGQFPVWTMAASTATGTFLQPLVPDATGLNCPIVGIKAAPGLPATVTVTATFTNADGTIATGVGVFNITQDPAELEVASFNVTIDPPVAQ